MALPKVLGLISTTLPDAFRFPVCRRPAVLLAQGPVGGPDGLLRGVQLGLQDGMTRVERRALLMKYDKIRVAY
jgi:hypothetical protein